MSSRKLGDIPLDDYLGWIRKQRPWRRPLKLLGLLGLCACSMAAGAFGPWSGMNADKLSLEHALTILASPDTPGEDRRAAIVMVHTRTAEALEQLHASARDSGRAGEDASRSLRHLTRRGIDCIKKLADQSDHSAIQQRSLEMMRADLAK
jgi:hypothetical protein